VIRLTTTVLMILLIGTLSLGAESYVASGYSPRENLCLNGTWDTLVWAQAKPDKDYDLTPVYPPTSSGGWYKAILPENLSHLAGECTEKGGQPPWRTVGYPSTCAWFRRALTVPAEWKGKRVLFRSGGVCYDASLYVNGRFMGRHRNILPFVFDITSAVQFGGYNQIDLGYLHPQILHIFQNEKDIKELEPDGEWTHVIVGPYGDLYLEPVGDVNVDEINIRCGWEKKELNVDIDLANPTHRKNITVDANILDGQTVIKTASAQLQKENKFKLQVFWPEVKPWQPGSPKLYRLELVVRADGKIADRYTRRFGFREFIIRDGSYRLNGKRINLICGLEGVKFGGQTFSPDLIRAYYRGMQGIHINTIRLHGTPFPTLWLDIADEEGMLIIDEGTFIPGPWDPHSTERLLYDFNRRWPRFAKFFEEWVIRDRNHPCVIQWSAENEPEANIPSREIFEIIRRTDGSGRPVFNDGDFSRYADVISPHYLVDPNHGPEAGGFPYWPDDMYFLDAPEFTATLFDRWEKWYLPNYNDQMGVRVKDAIKTCKALSAKPWDQRWVFDTPDRRPLSIGEAFLPEAWTIDDTSRYLGDQAYREVYDLEYGEFWQRWGQYCGNAIDAYRYMGVNYFNLPFHPAMWCFAYLFTPTGGAIVKELGKPLENTPGYHPYRIISCQLIFNPGWDKRVPEHILTAMGKVLQNAYQPLHLIVRPEQKSFYSRQKLFRQFGITNDTLEDQNLTLRIRLGKKEIFNKEYKIAAGSVARDQFSFDLAEVKPDELPLQAELFQNGKPVDRFEERIHIVARPPIPSGPEVVLFDPVGKTRDLFQRLNIKFTLVREPADLKNVGPAKPLVIGEEVLRENSIIAESIENWTASGGQILLLAQTQFGDLQTAMGGRIRTFTIPNSQSFIRNPGILTVGLYPEDLILWGSDHMVTRCSVQFERLGNVKLYADQGSIRGLVHPVLGEFFRNKGRLILLQALCVSKFDETPGAAQLLANAFEGLRRAVPTFLPLVVRNKETQLGFESIGIQCGRDGTGKVLFLTGKDDLTDRDLKADSAYKTIWINRPSADQLKTLSRYFGPLVLKNTETKHCQLEIKDDGNSILAGVASRDLFLSGNQPLAPRVFDIPAPPKENVLLVEPRYTPRSDTFGGVAPQTRDFEKPTMCVARAKIQHPGAAMIAYRTKTQTIILDMIDYDNFRHQESIRNFLSKVMTNLGVAVDARPAGKDTDTIGIVAQPAIFRVDCGAETGKRVIKKEMITERSGFGMSKDKEVVVAYTDHAGNDWLADQPWNEGAEYGYISGGTVDRGSDLEVAGTLDDELFRTERYRLAGYKFKLPSGKYLVRLFFAETFDGICAVGNRRFSVRANGQSVVDDLDIFKRVGQHRPLAIEKMVEVKDGLLDLKFIPINQDPCINAIEILPQN
jgi:hypothetical protein